MGGLFLRISFHQTKLIMTAKQAPFGRPTLSPSSNGYTTEEEEEEDDDDDNDDDEKRRKSAGSAE